MTPAITPSRERWYCPHCNYSASPNEIFTTRKHFDAHALECVRCLYRTETKTTWKEAEAAYRLAAKPADEGVREALIERECQRRCIAAEYTLERLALQDRRYRHDDRRPWWKAHFEPTVRAEIERLERAGFVVFALSTPAEPKP